MLLLLFVVCWHCVDKKRKYVSESRQAFITLFFMTLRYWRTIKQGDAKYRYPSQEGLLRNLFPFPVVNLYFKRSDSCECSRETAIEISK